MSTQPNTSSGNQFMPPEAASGGAPTTTHPTSTPSAAPLGTTPGVGLVVAHGTPTAWRPNGSATLDLRFSPFGPTGTLAAERFGPAWAGRYTGGDTNATYATPMAGAEWEPQVAGAMIQWFNAGRPAEGLPSGVSPAPGSFNGTPTDRERVDLIYHPEAFSFVAEWMWSRSPNQEGKTPETPMAVSRPDLPWAYFTEPHVQYPVTVYFRNTARDQSEISYSPPRRQKDHITGKEFGPRLQAYPQVFGPPHQPLTPPAEPVRPVDPVKPAEPADPIPPEDPRVNFLKGRLQTIADKARTYHDAVPTQGGGAPLNNARRKFREQLQEIIGLAEKI